MIAAVFTCHITRLTANGAKPPLKNDSSSKNKKPKPAITNQLTKNTRKQPKIKPIPCPQT
jgi:hypothetical protein